MANYDFEQKLQEKLEQLEKFKKGILKTDELADLITQRRVKWMDEHKNEIDEMKTKYEKSGLSLEEIAHKIIFIEHLKIDPKYSIPTRVSPTKIRINSYNPCPYLEACKKLGLETKLVCKEIGEPSFQKMIKMIDKNLKFGRNYDNIRPQNKDYCEEYIEFNVSS